MIDEESIKTLVKNKFPNWQVHTEISGLALWINLSDGSPEYFTIQVTPNDGVGVSIVNTSELDMSGHDEAFDDLESAFNHIDTLLSSKK